MQLQKRMQRMPEFVQRTVYDSSCEANISDSTPCCPYSGKNILCRPLLRFKPCICRVLSLPQLQRVTGAIYSGQALYRLGQVFA